MRQTVLIRVIGLLVESMLLSSMQAHLIAQSTTRPSNDDMLPPGLAPGFPADAPAPLSRQSVKLLKLTAINDAGSRAPLSAEDSKYVLFEAKCDPDWRVKICAIPSLHLIPDREKAIDVAIACTCDRDPQSSGDGCVPLYAVTALADMQARRAIPAVQDWLDYLKQDHSYGKSNDVKLLSRQGGEDLSRLEAATTQPAPK